jgi:hypothetical protein
LDFSFNKEEKCYLKHIRRSTKILLMPIAQYQICLRAVVLIKHD